MPLPADLHYGSTKGTFQAIGMYKGIKDNGKIKYIGKSKCT